MRTLINYLPLLGCAAMLLLVCGPMLFRRNHKADTTASTFAPVDEQIAELRDEVHRLKAELDVKDSREAERIDG